MAERNSTERPTLADMETGEIEAALAVLDALAADDSPDPYGDGLADWARQSPIEAEGVRYRLTGEQLSPEAAPLMTEAFRVADTPVETTDDRTAIIIDAPPAELAGMAASAIAAPVDPFADTQPLAALDEADAESRLELATPPIFSERAESDWLRAVPPLRLPETTSDDDDWRAPLPPADSCGTKEILASLVEPPLIMDQTQATLAALEATQGPADLPDLTDLAVMVDDDPAETIEITDDMIEPVDARPPLLAHLLD